VVQCSRIQVPRIFWAAFLVALWIAVASDCAMAQLETRGDSKVPGEAFTVASGDFNGDCKLDLAVADNGFAVLLGNGDGTFQKAVNYHAFSGLGVSIAAGDFNGDGKIDLVMSGPDSAVSVFLGNGDGTFQAPLVSSTSDSPTFIAVGDFNHDHKLDLAIIDPPYISVLLGNGDGTFQAPSDNSSFPDYPVWLAVSDFNNDHRPDVVVVGYFASNIDMGVLLGNGDGTLQPSLTYPLSDTPYSIATGDFNRDGNLDIAISDYFVPGDVVVLLGKGDGSFQAGVSYPTTGSGGQVVAEDFNGDGKLDLLLGGGVLLGKGDGTFGPVEVFPGGGSPLVVGDFNGDGKQDVVGLTSKPEGARTQLNTGLVNFFPSSPVSFPSQLINTTSGARAVKLTNTGTTALSISSVKISGQFQSSNDCGNSVAAGASCIISVRFSPKTAGWRSGLVTIVDSASSRPQVIELAGLGTALKLSPKALAFGPQKVHTTSPPQQITVTNESNNAVTFTIIAIGGRDNNDFAETQNCGSQLGPGASCTASITFTPTKTGARSAVAAFEVAGGANPPSVVLTGTGTN
jgi:hypothetical protein